MNKISVLNSVQDGSFVRNVNASRINLSTSLHPSEMEASARSNQEVSAETSRSYFIK